MNPLKYSLTGLFCENSFSIENAELRNANFYLKLWGIFEKGRLQLRGFSSLSDFFKTRHTQELNLSITEKLRRLFHKQSYDQIQLAMSSKSNLNILYVYQLPDAETPFELDLENLSFSLNNMPLRHP